MTGKKVWYRFHWERQTTERTTTIGDDPTDPPVPDNSGDWYREDTSLPELVHTETLKVV